MTDPRSTDPVGVPPAPHASDPVIPVPAEPDRGTPPEPPAEPPQTPPTAPPTEPPTAPPTAPPTEPPVAPPAPGPLDTRPEPKYGAYAPAGWQSPVPQDEPATPGDAGGIPPALEGSPWAAPVAPARAARTPGQPGQPAERQTWDLVLSIVLLAAGALFALIGIAFFVGMPAIMSSMYEQQSLGTYTETSRTAALSTWGAASQGIIFVIVAVFTILLLARRRIAFYVPLIGGVVGVILFWALLVNILTGDPALMEYYGNTTGSI